MSAKPKLPAWIETEKKQAIERRKTDLAEKGFENEPYTPEQGETKILIDLSRQPRETEGKFGTQAILKVTVNEEVRDWAINVRSPLWRQILEVLGEGINPFTLIRAGTGQATRYSIKEAKA